MAPRKLSDSDRRQITSIYCQPGETTSTLANKFGISSSTVSRVLKQMLPEAEYTQLMKWKRSGERGSFPLASSAAFEQIEATEPTSLPSNHQEAASDETQSDTVAATIEVPSSDEDQSDTAVSSETEVTSSDSDTASSDSKAATESEMQPTETASKKLVTRRSRRRSTAVEPDEAADLAASSGKEETAIAASSNGRSLPPSDIGASPEIAEELSDESDESDEDDEVTAWVPDGLGDDDFDNDDTDDDWDEDSWDGDDDEEEVAEPAPPSEAELSILSFERFSLTKPCYLVVDRLSELITCPLKDFSELGMIPPGEEQARTLPVFENHKIARRFARRNQRIIKVPNSLILNKTQEYLQAKGITRILFNGQVYALNT
ncbi:MAG: helix-turn-helix domain-containing protein [Leptolyngbyaceae cyanobacterium]